MRKIIRLNINDIQTIIAEYYKIPVKNITVIDCGYDKGDGPYIGAGNYCNIEIDVTDEEVPHART